MYNPLATLLNRRRPSRLRKADQALLAGPVDLRGSAPDEDGELGMVAELAYGFSHPRSLFLRRGGRYFVSYDTYADSIALFLAAD